MVFSWQGAEHFAAPEPQQLIVSLIPYMIVNILQHRCIIWAMSHVLTLRYLSKGQRVIFRL